MDNDDEVRDRAILYLQVLKQNQKTLSSTFVLNRKWSGWGWAMKWEGLGHEVGGAGP